MDELEKIEKFFKEDLAIKQEIINAKPNNEYGCSEELLVKYSDYLMKMLNYIEEIIKDMIKIKDSTMYTQKILEQKFKNYKEKLAEAGLDYNRLKKFYEKYFCSMKESFIKRVSEECVGYYESTNFNVILESESINELLHGIHQSVINDDKLYKKMPILDEKYTEYNEYFRLYGKSVNKIAQEIFYNMPMEIIESDTDILSLENKTLMLCRDMGHAMVIEINEKDEKCEVNYFIPKICNVEMINELRGVRKVTSQETFTTGMFDTNIENISHDIIDLMSKVPTDTNLNSKYLQN